MNKATDVSTLKCSETYFTLTDDAMNRLGTDKKDLLLAIHRFLSQKVTCWIILEVEKLYVIIFFFNKK